VVFWRGRAAGHSEERDLWNFRAILCFFIDKTRFPLQTCADAFDGTTIALYFDSDGRCLGKGER